MREFLVEIQISEPKGEGLDDFGDVGKVVVRLPEHYTSADLSLITFKIRQKLEAL
jgi:hypothetical protein